MILKYAVAIGFLMSAGGAFAAPIASESFSYDAGGLAGKSSGSGWVGAWSAVEWATVVNPAPDLSAAGVNGGDRALQIGNGGTHDPDATSLIYRSFAEQTGDVYVSVLFRAASPSADFFALWLDDGASDSNHAEFVPNFGLLNTTNTFFGRYTINHVSSDDTTVAANTDYLLVARIFKGPNTNNDRYNAISIWVNPGAGDEASPDATFELANPTDDRHETELSRIGIRVAANAGGEQYWIDELNLSTTFAEVVPEPATASVLGLAGLLALMPRRRRQA